MSVTVKGMEKIDKLVTKVQLLAKNPQNILGEYIVILQTLGDRYNVKKISMEYYKKK
jgi:hypothetical protein